ncbi:MAG: MFS transporter [Gammaproteobacteria bacterium]|nr:MFS transporter [Gammaproteobacteria bacterium]
MDVTDININKLQLLVLCLLATFIISGVVTTMGLVTPSAAEHFDVDVTSMAAQFTWLTGGVFGGFLLSFVVFDYFSIKKVLIVTYVVCITSLLLIHVATDYQLLALWMAVFGVAISLASCGSGTLITQLWSGKARQTVLVAQDAMFNGGGVIFSLTTTWFITNNYPFSSIYVVVAAIVTFALILSLVSNFEKDLASSCPENIVARVDTRTNKYAEQTKQSLTKETAASTIESEQDMAFSTEEEGQGKTEWNVGIILTGISLMFFMLAKISMFIWAPQYVEQNFGVGADASGQFMSNIFSAALVGSLAGTWLVSRINVKYLLYTFIIASALSIWLLINTSSIDTVYLLAFVYGISISATFNAYVAFSLSFVAVPTHRNIAYMLLMSALGSSGAPYFSSLVVETTGDMQDALLFCFGVLLTVIVSLGICEMLDRNRTRSNSLNPSGC